MFNDEYFATTKALFAKMVEPFMQEAGRGYRRWLNLRGKAILDPSAGSGTLLDFVRAELDGGDAHGYGGQREKLLYCCEIDPQLKAVLQDKQYRQLADDFLHYQGDTIFDVILMNPPFKRGDEHVIKAFEIVGAAGHVVALVNSETLRNPYTATRKHLARLVADYGEAEELGRPFLDEEAERRTDVEVSLIRLRKPETDNPFSFQWQGRTREGAADLNENTFKSQLATRDVIGNMITQFAQLKEQFVALLRALDGINYYGAGLTKSEYRTAHKIAFECVEQGRKGDAAGYAKSYNAFADAMRQEIWGLVLDRVNIQKYMTHKVRENFTTFAQQQGYMDFTHENVGQLVGLVLENSAMILEQAVVDLFDEFTRYHKENRQHVEGWVTNDRYKVNRRIILPYWVSLCEIANTFSLNHHRHSQYSDIDKVMCYLTGRNYDHCHTIARALETRFRTLGRVGSGSFDGTCRSEFFNLRFFKKGTLHLEFRDERLWQEFNLRACAGKLWLPEPEMRAYQQRKRGPFDPEPQPAPMAAPAPVMRRLPGPGTQLSLLDMAA